MSDGDTRFEESLAALRRFGPAEAATQKALEAARRGVLDARAARRKTRRFWMKMTIPSGIAAALIGAAVLVTVMPGSRQVSAAEQLQQAVEATKAYKGQTELALFIECLVGSDWWFWDYTGSHTGHLPLSKTEPPAQGHHRSDLLHAWAVLGGSESAWNAFLDAFNDHIVRTAITWCHRAIPARVCRNCKPGVVHGCDAFGDAYLYILERLRSTALAAYGGHTALSSFVFLCLHDYRWWASFVQKETGKIKLPKALSDEPELVQVLYFRIAWGWDNERIATGLQMPLQVVEETRGHIEEKLRNAGRTISPRKIETISLSALSPGTGDAEQPLVAEPRSSEISPEVRAEAVRYWSKLSVQDRTLLRLMVESKKSVKEVAGVLGINTGQAYGAIYRIRKEMPEWFKM